MIYEPRKICIIKTSDDFYKVVRISGHIMTSEFLETRFSLGVIYDVYQKAVQAASELQLKEAFESGLGAEKIEIIQATVSKPLSELCETDKRGYIKKYKNSGGEWIEVAGGKTAKAKVKTVLYDIKKLEDKRIEALSRVVYDKTSIPDFYAEGKSRALGELLALDDIKIQKENIQKIIDEETELTDEDLYASDIKYHQGLSDGFSVLESIIRDTPLLGESVKIHYIIYIAPDFSAWEDINSKDTWTPVEFLSNIEISVFYTDNLENAIAEFEKCNEKKIRVFIFCDNSGLSAVSEKTALPEDALFSNNQPQKTKIEKMIIKDAKAIFSISQNSEKNGR